MSDSIDAARFARGVAAFNDRRFYEAHEIWEAIWSEDVGERRLALQALIQAAAGFHKAEIGVPNGARKLWRSSLRLLEHEPDDTWGVDIVKLRADIRAALDGSAPGCAAPRIESR